MKIAYDTATGAVLYVGADARFAPHLIMGAAQYLDRTPANTTIVDGDAEPGQTWNGSGFNDLPLRVQVAINAVEDRIMAKRREVLNGGVKVGAALLPTTPEARTNYELAAAWLADNPGQEAEVELLSGRVVTLTLAQLNAVRSAVRNHVQNCNKTARQKFNAVNALTSVASVRAFDVDSGWPSNT